MKMHMLSGGRVRMRKSTYSIATSSHAIPGMPISARNHSLKFAASKPRAQKSSAVMTPRNGTACAGGATPMIEQPRMRDVAALTRGNAASGSSVRQHCKCATPTRFSPLFKRM